MLPRTWMEAYLRFLLRYRWPVLATALAVTLFLGYHLSSTRSQMNFLDIVPPNHPYTQLARKHVRMFGSANVLVVAVEVKNGDIYNLDTLNKIDRLTIAMMETPGVNPWQVRSISHPAVRSTQVTSAGIHIIPFFFPGPPKDEKAVARIKKAIYTNDGVLDFYVSRDNKVALITAGFWESGLNFARMKERLFQLQAQETDANKEEGKSMDTLQKRALRIRIVSMTGIIESFTERLDQYWGYVKMVSLEKPPTS